MTAFATAIALTRREVFDALEACAIAERALLRSGCATEAAAVAAVFELLEDRVVLDPLPDTGSWRAPGSCREPGRWNPSYEPFGSNSSESEFTQ